MKPYRHNLRLLPAGACVLHPDIGPHWLCAGGLRPPAGQRCGFETRDYGDAVNHATAHGATPPDMPRDLWVTA